MGIALPPGPELRLRGVLGPLPPVADPQRSLSRSPTPNAAPRLRHATGHACHLQSFRSHRYNPGNRPAIHRQFTGRLVKGQLQLDRDGRQQRRRSRRPGSCPRPGAARLPHAGPADSGAARGPSGRQRAPSATWSGLVHRPLPASLRLLAEALDLNAEERETLAPTPPATSGGSTLPTSSSTRRWLWRGRSATATARPATCTPLQRCTATPAAPRSPESWPRRP